MVDTRYLESLQEDLRKVQCDIDFCEGKVNLEDRRFWQELFFNEEVEMELRFRILEEKRAIQEQK